MPRIRDEEPSGPPTKPREARLVPRGGNVPGSEPDMVPRGARGLGRPSRTGLMQSGSGGGGIVAQVTSHYKANKYMYDVAGAGMIGLLFGLMVSGS